MKKTYPIRYLLPAEKDLEEIFDYICRDSPPRASKFLNKLNRSISRLSSFPLLGAVPKDRLLQQKTYRVLIVDNYLAFYRFKKKNIIIYRILHGKRRYEFCL